MKLILYFSMMVIYVGCAHSPKCGNLEGAKIILDGKTSCLVRIRQVEIGSNLKIPESLKNPELAVMELTWVDPVFIDGQITMGHFKLKPKLTKNQKNE